MNCKKCGRPMGKKGYCASCEPQKAQPPVKKNNKKLWLIIGGCALAAVLIVTACLLLCGGDDEAPLTSQQGEATVSGKHHVEIDIRDYGTVKVELDADVAPITVENFISLAESGFYDGVPFHRIMEGFMMQGGDPDGDGMTNADQQTIKGEFSSNGIENPLSHTRGAISMARLGGDMDSASSQFFIVHEDSTFLDGDYACFGYVTEGMDVVDTICEFSTSVVTDDNGSVPAQYQPIIETVRVID